MVSCQLNVLSRLWKPAVDIGSSKVRMILVIPSLSSVPLGMGSSTLLVSYPWAWVTTGPAVSAGTV